MNPFTVNVFICLFFELKFKITFKNFLSFRYGVEKRERSGGPLGPVMETRP